MLLVMSVAAMAQGRILDKIEEKNSSVEAIEAHFDQVKTLPATGKEIKSEGTLYFNAKDRMSMIYTDPASDVFIIDRTKLCMVRSGKRNVYDITKNALMGSLSSTLLNCITGKIRTLAVANDAEIGAEQTSEGYVVTLTARKKASKGYSKIVLLYDPATCILKRMEMVEFSQISTLYKMSSIKTGVNIDPYVYAFPEK